MTENRKFGQFSISLGLSDSECGGNYTNDGGFIISPSYPNPYPYAQDCIYLISQPKGTYVNISFVSMDIVCDEMYSTSDYLEIRDGKSGNSPVMGVFCGNTTTVPAFMLATQNYLRIR